MPAAVIGGILAAGGAVGGAAIAANASKSAASQQQASASQALGVQQQEYANAQKLLQPYLYGGPALSGLNYRVTASGAPSPYQGISGAPSFGSPYAPGVLMRAPDGTQQQVPAALVPHYLSRGAEQV